MNPTAIIALVAFAFGVLSGSSVVHWRAGAHLAETKAEHAAQLAAAHQDAQMRESEARVTERRRAFNIMEKADAANLIAAKQRAAADRARAAVGELRSAYTTVAAALGRAAEDTPAATGSPPASGAGVVLADVFSWCGTRLQSCAAALDESRLAGQLCEQSYDIVALP